MGSQVKYHWRAISLLGFMLLSNQACSSPPTPVVSPSHTPSATTRAAATQIATPFLTPLPSPPPDSLADCGEPTDAPAPSFEYDVAADLDRKAEPLLDQIGGYLAATGSIAGLQSAIEASTEEIELTAQIVTTDATGDSRPDVLININLLWGGGFTGLLTLFECANAGFQQRSTVSNGGFGAGVFPPSWIELTADLNNNGLREVIVSAVTVEGMKGHETLTIYEWDGERLTPVYEVGPYYREFGAVALGNWDDDPTTLEFTISYFYAYEEETALAFIEYSFIRPINMVYGWDGVEYREICRYFTDQPTLRLSLLHSAETLRECGLYDAAAVYYEELMNDYRLEARHHVDVMLQAWPYQPQLVYPEGIADDERQSYAAELERMYLQAFAGYRLAQLALLNPEDPWMAEVYVSLLQSAYAPGDQGYAYVGMAAALWENYQATKDLARACEAAADAFRAAREDGTDPGIEYTKDQAGLPYGFYFSSGHRYGSNPDDLFAVPVDIDGMIRVPICLK